MANKLSLSDRLSIVDADYGRDFGWHVLSPAGDPVAKLSDPEFTDTFWTSYVVTPIAGQDETLTAAFWSVDCHRIRNIAFPCCLVDTFGHFNIATRRVTLRSAYIRVQFSWFDRIRKPLWFVRRWPY
ncbi:hypothetical protein [Allorhodopirellula solitaria]|nr:hypothetical protein [Allorhodopirellula solitaria]